MRIYIFFLVIVLISGTHLIFAEEEYKDVTASVMVSSTFEVSTEAIPIDFGVIDSGEAVELYPDRYFNEVRCISNHGRTWFLKAACGDLTSPNASISKTHLKIKVFWTNGKGNYSFDWVSFEDVPVLVYTSGDADNTGNEVRMQFKYKLDPLIGVPAGNYGAIVTYTMSEAP